VVRLPGDAQLLRRQHRLPPQREAPFPAQLHDVKAAVRWLRANAHSYGIDPERIGIWGGSSGAHLAAPAGVTGDSGDPQMEGDSGSAGHSGRVQALVWKSGVSDFLRRG
jgi:acetyl esterase/lipase